MQCLQQAEAVAARWGFKSRHAQSKPWPAGAVPEQVAYTTFSNKTRWLSLEQMLHVACVLPVTVGVRWRQYRQYVLAATQWAHLCLMPGTKYDNEHTGTHRHARPCSLHVQPFYKAWNLVITPSPHAS